MVPTLTMFMKSLLNMLAEKAEGNIRYGMAPPSAAERALRKLLASIGGD